MGDILFMRKYPACFGKGLRGVLGSFSKKGFTEIVAGRVIYFFFPGYGKKVRPLPEFIAGEIRSGKISDVIDVGAGGALIPGMKAGDLVLSRREICCDGSRQENSRHCSMAKIALRLAKKRNVALWSGRVLTSDKIVSGWAQRLDHLVRFDAVLVQMEHGWFLNQLQKQVGSDAFQSLRFTHLEMVADGFPRHAIWHPVTFWSVAKAMAICSGWKLDKLKADFLSAFLTTT